MPIIDWVNPQGSLAWYQARAGIPTASEFDHVMTPKTLKPAESRKKYACRLIAERILNWQADSLDKIGHIADGKANEPLAVAKMDLVFDIESTRVGVIKTNDGRFGATPDRVAQVSPDRTRVGISIECKCPTIPVQMERLIFGETDEKVAAVYRCQRQGQLWVAEADKAIFFSFNPRTPDYLVEDGRDEGFIKALVDCLERFSDELEQWTERARSAGAYQAFEALVTPVDAERGPMIDELDRILDD